MKGENYRIALTQNARPFAVAAPRRVSAPLLSKVEEELDRLHSEGIIEPVVEPTDWCAPIVVVPRKTVLVFYNKNRKTRVAADASSFGLGGVIEQFVDGKWKPITYASRSLSPTEMRYAQIEKEALALTWACSRKSKKLRILMRNAEELNPGL
ncbi:uncharacterized protein LOC129000651 [Macrosteles quadrilineatus]|uniref:uncharacterized protein LOC129000651 n=1 Tax=Macrosteles quadrilineatus TaxID=74068 RepID=UPI0023E14816|nr:uncharacterized protein LOC129000651 [Macrosteles quadrilineatus]